MGSQNVLAPMSMERFRLRKQKSEDVAGRLLAILAVDTPDTGLAIYALQYALATVLDSAGLDQWRTEFVQFMEKQGSDYMAAHATKG